MSEITLKKRIELLPSELQKQVADFVDFLIIKYKIKDKQGEEFSKDEKAELDEIWKNYLKSPDNVISLDTARKQTKTKYGL